jgi:hypothetical protein
MARQRIDLAIGTTDARLELLVNQNGARVSSAGGRSLPRPLHTPQVRMRPFLPWHAGQTRSSAAGAGTNIC